jgi:hypothetical protein
MFNFSRSSLNQVLQAQHPDKSVMLIAEKGTMGVGHQECQV